MERLHLISSAVGLDPETAVKQSDWARFLPDPTMLDVSLYFARHVYAERQQRFLTNFLVDAYKGRALRSLRKRIEHNTLELSDSLVAAILTLSVLDVGIFQHTETLKLTDSAKSW
jgi:hypothetical protein